MRALLLVLLVLTPALPRAESADAPAGAEDSRCTPDGQRCIRLSSFIPDTCALIESSAADAAVDAHFLARLLWRESRFDPAALSPVGAQGIAQFMPGTAAIRGLGDPWNPAEAIEAAATYLAELTAMFGNPGLAAAAYNGGEAAVTGFLAETRGLAGETRAYVRAITGFAVEEWRDTPPDSADYRLDGETPFREACTTLAQGRAIREFRAPTPAWGVIVAAGRSARLAESFGRAAAARSGDVIDAGKLVFVQAVIPGMGRRPQFTAQVPAESRAEALALCERLRGRGGYCRVVQN